MTMGYIARFFSARTPTEMMPFIAQSLFIILPPSLYAATIYMIYGRLVVFVDAAAASIIRPSRVTKIFVTGDVLAFFMQAGGGGMMAVAEMADLGQKIMLVGLFVQLLFFGFFLVIAVVFFRRLKNSPAGRMVPRYGRHEWSALLKMMLCAAVVVIARCVFRVVEFAQGHSGYLASREVFVYVCDTLPMLLVQVMFHFVRADEVFGSRSMRMGKGEESVIGLYERT